MRTNHKKRERRREIKRHARMTRPKAGDLWTLKSPLYFQASQAKVLRVFRDGSADVARFKAGKPHPIKRAYNYAGLAIATFAGAAQFYPAAR